MNNVYDEVEQWNINITGLDSKRMVLVGARSVITKEMFESANFPINKHEFDLLWHNIIEKAKNTSMDEVCR